MFDHHLYNDELCRITQNKNSFSEIFCSADEEFSHFSTTRHVHHIVAEFDAEQT
jgi:hypothetical protein